MDSSLCHKEETGTKVKLTEIIEAFKNLFKI